MRVDRRFAVALLIGVVVATAAAVWALAGQEGLETEELLRVEVLPDSSLPIDVHLNRVFASLTGDAPWTDEQFETSFSDSFAVGTNATELNIGLEQVFANLGHVAFVRIVENDSRSVKARAVAEDGTPLEALIILSEDERMETMGLDVVSTGSRLEGWASTLTVVAGWLFLAAAASAHRSDRTRRPWMLLVGSVVALSAVLILSESRVAYSLGRILPTAALAIGVWLLVDRNSRTEPRWLLLAAAAAVGVGVLAPLARDAGLIGHPQLVGAFTDDDVLYRVLLTASAALGALAMAGVAVLTTREIGGLTAWRRAPRSAAAATATVWACAATGSAIDYAVGDGSLAGGLFGAATWAAFAAVPVVVTFKLVGAQWDSPELTNLVIDLDTARSELEPAAQRALDDPTLQVLTSEDGETLVDNSGTLIDPDRLPPERTLTRIRSRGQLIGALVRDASLERRAAEVSSVASAAGLALEVQRLDRQVIAQIDEVKASRSRIVHASDAARHRIERDLHDGAQQRLVALGLALQRARRASAAAGHHAESEQLENATAEVREILDELRSVAHGSRPALLAERGLAPAIDALAERAPVPVRIDIAPDPIPDDAATTVYFVVAEALTNIAKHAEATSASVVVERCDGSARVQIADDGQGGAVVAPGSGLQGLEDRVAASGGSFAVRSGQSGTTLEASIPCG